MYSKVTKDKEYEGHYSTVRAGKQFFLVTSFNFQANGNVHLRPPVAEPLLVLHSKDLLSAQSGFGYTTKTGFGNTF